MIKKTKFIGLLAIMPLVLTALVANYANDTYALKNEGTSLPQIGSTNSPVCGDKLCGEVESSSDNNNVSESEDNSSYVYKQDFLPLQKMDIDLETTAIF